MIEMQEFKGPALGFAPRDLLTILYPRCCPNPQPLQTVVDVTNNSGLGEGDIFRLLLLGDCLMCLCVQSPICLTFPPYGEGNVL